MQLTSAAGIIALLDEPESEIKAYSLAKLNQIVNVFWPEIADAISQIEVLYEDENFNDRELAALVASKVYYHLGAYNESVSFALGAGEHFDVNSSSQFVETIIAKCIDQYTQLRIEEKPIDPRLESIVNQMFQRCFTDHQYRQAVGIALETRRLDIFIRAITEADDVEGMLQYSLRVCMTLIENRQFRNEVLRKLVDLYLSLRIPDFISVCQCLIFLDEAQSVADILLKMMLREEKEDSTLMGYQIAFDLYENATQQFLNAVCQALVAASPVPTQATSISPPSDPGSSSTVLPESSASGSVVPPGSPADAKSPSSEVPPFSL